MIASKEIPQVARYIEANLAAGLPVGRVFKMCAAAYPKYADDFIRASSEMDDGVSVAEALNQVSLFNEITIEQVRLGDESGQLDKTFSAIRVVVTQQNKIASNFKKAMLMPAIVISFALFVTIFVMSWVIPSLAESVGQRGGIIDVAVSFGSLFDGRGYLYPLIAIMQFSFVLFLFKSEWIRKTLGSVFSDFKFMRTYFFGIWASFMAMALRSGITLDKAVYLCGPILPEKLSEPIRYIFNEIYEVGSEWANVLDEEYFSENDFRRRIPEIVRVNLLQGGSTGRLDTALEGAGEQLMNDFAENAGVVTSVIEILSPVLVGMPVGLIFYVFYDIVSSVMGNIS